MYEKPRYMSVAQAAQQLLEVISSRATNGAPFKCTYLYVWIMCNTVIAIHRHYNALITEMKLVCIL